MALLKLDQQNPEYIATLADRVKSRHLFDGVSAVKEQRTTYLFQRKNEDDDDYAIRLKRATLDPYIEKIVQSRQAVIHGKPHTRTVPQQLEAFMDDIDGKGTSASTFFEECTREAQIDGIHWVLIDMPRLPEGGYATAADERAAGVRPFMQHVPASAVIDWQVGADRRLDWAVVSELVQKAPIEPGGEREFVQQYKVWTRNDWRIYQPGEGKEASQTVIAEGVHGLGEVPLVPFFGVKKTDYSGCPVARTVLDHIVQLYNKESDLDWYETLAAHPIPYVISPKNLQKLDVSKGIWIESDATTARYEIGYLEIAGTAFDALRQSINDLIARVLSTALAQAKKDSAQVQSADGQREDRKMFTTSLKSSAIHAQHSEQRCWKTLAKWLNVNTDIKQLDITYNTDFDDRTIEAQMIAVLSDLVDTGRITAHTLLRILQDGEVIPADVDIDAEIEATDAQRAIATAQTLKLIQDRAADQNAPPDPSNPGTQAA